MTLDVDPAGIGLLWLPRRSSTSGEPLIFPDNTRESYVLPVKRAVCAAGGIAAGDSTTVTVELIDL